MQSLTTARTTTVLGNLTTEENGNYSIAHNNKNEKNTDNYYNKNKSNNDNSNSNSSKKLLSDKAQTDNNTLTDPVATTSTTTTTTLALNALSEALEAAETKTTSTMSDVEERQRQNTHLWQAIDENYVCDISMMKIDDTHHHHHPHPHHQHHHHHHHQHLHQEQQLMNLENNIANTNEEVDDDEDVDVADNVDEEHSNAEHEVMMMDEHEVEIERRAEEETITELVRTRSERQLIDAATQGRLRVVFGVLVRLVLPLANGVARGFKGIRDVRLLRLLQNLASSRHALTNLMAFAANTISMNLSSVQVTNRIGPLLQFLKLRKSGDGIESLPDNLSITGNSCASDSTPTTPSTPVSSGDIWSSPFLRKQRGSLPTFSTVTIPSTSLSKRNVDELAPNCCILNILAEPPPDVPIRADIVFIHGLHGSLVNTWKQGLWENERQPEEFERPPRPPVRPPKRPRHSRTSSMHMPPREKRAKFASQPRKGTASEQHDELAEEQFDFESKAQAQSFDDYSYVCGEPEDIKICDGIEYSFPTFRLRMNEHSRLLQAELESMLNNENANTTNEQMDGKHDRKQKQSNAKASANDPNYSKCWPGDWLPLDCPGVRVIALNYTTDQYLWRPLWKNKEPRSNLVQRSREMAELLVKHRVGYGHPIVYVGHSKGGLFIKQIIVEAWENGRPAMTPLWRSARGTFFYSVPHRGAHLACIKAPLLSRSVELLDIEKNNKYLLDLHRRFAGLYHLGHLKIEVFSFVETALTLMSVLYLRIVGVDSADPGIGDVCGIRLDHREICKPRSRDCILYKELVKMIKKVC